MQFTRNGHESVSISLTPGSLYVMNPPTNPKWLNSIVKDTKVKETRFSIDNSITCTSSATQSQLNIPRLS